MRTRVSETSIDHFHSRRFQLTAGRQREQIASLLLVSGPMTGHEIARALDMETGAVSGRLREMLDADEPVIVRLPTKRECSITGNSVFWHDHRDNQSGHQMGLAV